MINKPIVQKKILPKKIPVSPLVAIITAAAAAIAPFTMRSEGTLNKAYLDPAKIATICTGHTKGVKLGQVATNAQCAQYLKEDMEAHMNDVVKVNPELTHDLPALQAAGDFAFNAGGGAWKSSPMSAYFKQGQRAKACNSFIGYYTGATFAKPQKNLICKPHATKSGKWKCELGGLVKRRLSEAKICSTGKW